MKQDPIVHYIPPKPIMREIKVGIYCRVSKNDKEQLNSLSNQISGLTRLVAANPKWLLLDIYIDIASSKTGSSRKEFTRMIEDIKSKNIEVVITKSVSRFGRDTVDVLEALNVIKNAQARIIFEQEQIDSKENDSDMIISVITVIAQAENETRSENIKWGLQKKAAQGISKLYNRKCYGYSHDSKGELIINEEEAKVVRKIFDWYLDGKSIIGIVKALQKEEIKTSTGKDVWSKRAIETILSNEKYIGSVRLTDPIDRETQYLSKQNHPAIIKQESLI
ncbi:recombinase family protein [Facklamia sp. P12955]|uniref:recombinase family protein n=1 Tax=Facklamia sp. P12955 TaxID=3421946 RepID=UPI003D184719